jgi:hypothetical protein
MLDEALQRVDGIAYAMARRAARYGCPPCGRYRAQQIIVSEPSVALEVHRFG